MLKERTQLLLGIALSLTFGVATAEAQATQEEAPKGQAEPAASGSLETPPPPPAAATAAEPATPEPPPTPHPTGLSLEWHGNAEIDFAHAKYTHSLAVPVPDTANDARGRFVIGPDLIHWFTPRTYLMARGQMVGWVRESSTIPYQVSTDDVFGRVGQEGLWAVTVGRFMTTRIYQRGLGFDLFTLEDLGALLENSRTASPIYYPRNYEVDQIFLRNQSGRLALNLTPTKWSMVELVSEFGAEGQGVSGNSGKTGFRAAAAIDIPNLYVGAGAETQTIQTNIDGTGCPNCGKKYTLGYGGSIVGRLRPFEAGVSIAHARRDEFNPGTGIIQTSSNDVDSKGGYFEFDFGWVLMKRSFKLGFAIQSTVRQDDGNPSSREVGDRLTHTQKLAYLVYPLGFNNSVVKLVFTRADGEQDRRAGTSVKDDDLTAVRLRYAIYF